MAANKDLKMQDGDLLEMQGLVDTVHTHDSVVGRALQSILHHLAHAHGLDVADVQEKARKDAEERQKAENERLQAENAQIEQERAEVRDNMDPVKETIAVPVASLPSQQDDKGAK